MRDLSEYQLDGVTKRLSKEGLDFLVGFLHCSLSSESDSVSSDADTTTDTKIVEDPGKTASRLGITLEEVAEG